MTKMLIPFWFIDAAAAEKKLERLAAEGFELTDFFPISGVFSFERTNMCSTDTHYRIVRAPKCCSKAPKGVTDSGWELACGSKNYYIVRCSGKPIKQLSYDSWKTLNSFITMLLFFIFCFFSGTILGEIMATNMFNVLSFRAAALFIVFIAMMHSFCIGRKYRKLDPISEKLRFTVPEENFIYTRKQEKQMLRSGSMMKKAPLGWFYEPDTAEKMVEDMAAKGWSFYRFNKLGTEFYFVRSEPSRIKFVVDYQNIADDGYFVMMRESGFKLEFTSIARIGSFAVWSARPDENGLLPEFYSDSESNYKRAKRQALTFSLSYIAIVIIYAEIAVSILNDGKEKVLYMTALFIVIILEYGWFALKSIRYFLRIRKIRMEKTKG